MLLIESSCSIHDYSSEFFVLQIYGWSKVAANARLDS